MLGSGLQEKGLDYEAITLFGREDHRDPKGERGGDDRKRRLRLIDFASVRSLTWLRERFLQQTEGWHGEWCRRICPSA